MNATLESVLEGSLAASTGMNLCLDDEFALIQSSGHGFRFGRCVGDASRLGGNTEFGEKFTGLKFVDIHNGLAELIHLLRSEEKNSLSEASKKRF